MAKKKDKATKKEEKSLKDKVKESERNKVQKMARLGEKKRVDVITSGKKEKKIPLQYAIFLVAIVGIIGAIILLANIPTINTATVKEGDIVQILYTGSLENGTVFESGNFTFTAGTGEVIEGMDEAVLGMREGESKHITIPPEKAYGYYDENAVLEIPRIQEIDRIETITSDIFEETFGVPPIVNEFYNVEGMEWSLKVLSIENDTVKLEHAVEDGKVINMTDGLGMSYGSSVISLNGDKITITSTPIIGSHVVIYGVGQGVVTGMTDTHMTMDFNHKFADQTLNFDITILNFISS